MRQEILDYVGTISLGTFRVSQELPFDSNGQALFAKNPKRIYVASDEIQQDTVIATLDGNTLENETTTVRVYFTSDAKNPPSNYDSLVASIKLARNVTSLTGLHRRTCNVIKNIQEDLMVTEFELQFTKLI